MVAAALAAGLLAGCGIPADRDPRPIDPPRGPADAVASRTPAVTESGPVPERLFMVKDELLVEVTRRVEGEPTLNGLVRDLLTGPTRAERDMGITSALIGPDVVSSVLLADGRAVVELAAPIEGTGSNDEVLAYAQLVCTLAARAGVDGVTFTRDRRPVEVPRGDGSLSLGPFTAADYADLLAPK
jgi:hypothetical protein